MTRIFECQRRETHKEQALNNLVDNKKKALHGKKKEKKRKKKTYLETHNW